MIPFNARPTPRRACLSMPGYGHMTAGASRGLWRASKGPAAKIPLDVVVNYGKGSLLAQNFNGQWCTALNECLRGRTIHYFAMLHSDVEPEDGWLDVLVEELEAKELDLLGAVVPIKDPTGLTSLALARSDGDNWRPLCRLTMREVYQLPETFTSSDVGHPLLLNTGCWVCRFDPAWASKVHFTINDRIVLNTKLNIYQAQVEPEDWFFSRLCHELKLNIGATRKVRLDHAGETRYTNSQPWGRESFDETYVAESQIPQQPGSGWKFPADIEGWLDFSEGKVLADLAAGRRVLEIGSYCGRSTICIAQTAKEVVSVDPHDGRGTTLTSCKTFSRFRDNLDRYGITNVNPLIGTSEEWCAEMRGSGEPPFDLVFIDGAHDVESVRSDIKNARSLLKPSGLIAFHDYRESPDARDGRFDPGVRDAVKELIAEGGRLLTVNSTLAVVKPPSFTPVLETSHGI